MQGGNTKTAVKPLTDRQIEFLQRKLQKLDQISTFHRAIAFLCRQICRWNPAFCKHHTSCERELAGYDHKKNGCECRVVHYDTEN